MYYFNIVKYYKIYKINYEILNNRKNINALKYNYNKDIGINKNY